MHFKAPQPSQSAGVMLLERKECHDEPLDVGGAWLQLETRSRLSQCVDCIETTYGKHRVFLGSSVSWPSRCWGLLSDSQRGPPQVMGSRGILYRTRFSIPWSDSNIPSCVISPHAFFMVNHTLVICDMGTISRAPQTCSLLPLRAFDHLARRVRDVAAGGSVRPVQRRTEWPWMP
jgi:hypothetical protein